MKTIGGYLFFLGAGSIVLSFLNYEFSILAWIDNWGAPTGWAIRIGMAVAGAALWLLGREKTAQAA
jgi:hypothetical protein